MDYTTMKSGAAGALTDFHKYDKFKILYKFKKAARPWLSPELTGYNALCGNRSYIFKNRLV